MRRLGGLLGALVFAALLLGGLALLFRDDLARLRGRDAPVAEVSPAAAAQAEAKLDRLRNLGDTVRLSGLELTSLMRYRLGGWVPGVVSDPSVVIVGDTLRLSGRFPADRFPQIQELERLRPLLPDTAPVELRGRLRPLAPGQASFHVDELSAAGLPIPKRFYPRVLEHLGWDHRGGSMVELPLALPEGIGAVRASDGALILFP